MKRVCRCIVFGVFFLVSILRVFGGSGLCIERVTVDYLPASFFTRISEYFTGCENLGGDTILRTQRDCREGMYFMLKLSCQACSLPGSSKVLFEYLEKGESVERKKVWNLKQEKVGRTRNVYVGLTGQLWYGRQRELQAWSISILAPDGDVISTEKSYLWSKQAA